MHLGSDSQTLQPTHAVPCSFEDVHIGVYRKFALEERRMGIASTISEGQLLAIEHAYHARQSSTHQGTKGKHVLCQRVHGLQHELPPGASCKRCR